LKIKIPESKTQKKVPNLFTINSRSVSTP